VLGRCSILTPYRELVALIDVFAVLFSLPSRKAGFAVLMAASMKMAVFWVVAVSIIGAIIEAASTWETSINFYQTTQPCDNEDSHLQISCDSTDFESTWEMKRETCSNSHKFRKEFMKPTSLKNVHAVL
jgi:tRNA G10  N-methylase Trm11